MPAIPSSSQTETLNLARDLARFAHFKEIYNSRADDYERIRSCRDHEQKILPALNRIRPLAGLDVVESGAGSGHLTAMLAPIVNSIQAFDISQALLDIATLKLSQIPQENWRLGVADHRRLPVEDYSADMLLAGYSLCHLVDENLERWREEVGKALAEMKRILRPGGMIVLLESLGRGGASPQPASHLVPYFEHLQELGFSSTEIRTDYQFQSLDEVDKLVRSAFGDELADHLIQQQSVLLPAWTAIYWLNP